MNQKLLTKVLATMLVVTLTFANFILLGVYATSYATETTLEKQGTTTNNENVEFDAYFKGEQNKTTHSVTYDFDEENAKLYISIQVKQGYLKDAKVQITGENNTNSNFKIIDSNQTLEFIEKIDSDTNQVTLKQLNAGTQIVLEIPVVALKQEQYDLNNLSKINDIKLSGSYVGNNGKTVTIQKTIQTRNEWTNEVTPVIEQELTKFVPYEVEEKSGTILQTLVKTGLENNSLPIKETNIEVKVPTIEGQLPNKVWVTSNGTESTNGKDGLEFTNEQWNYDATTGIITINVKNEADNNIVSWNQNGKDEYVIGYHFERKLENVATEQKVSLNITAYNSIETKVEKQDVYTINQNTKLGDIVTGNIATTEAMSKGLLYANSEKETTYNENVTIEISDTELVDTVAINQNIDCFVAEDGQQYQTALAGVNYTYYKSTKISKQNFEQILGNEGSIKIYSQDGEELTLIDKNTQIDENGNYEFTYNKEVNQIKIETSKPVANGKLEIKHEKALKGKTDYSKLQIASFKTIEENISVDTIIANTAIANAQAKAEINLIDPHTQVEASTNTNTLSTVVKNENVELRVILKTNDISCDLYKNPVVEMILPSYVEEFEIKDIKLVFDDELSIKDYTVSQNENGNKVLRVAIIGEDTKYSQDELSKGANLVVNADITLQKLTPTKEGLLQVYVSNENATNYGVKARALTTGAYAETTLRAVAPVGIVTTNTIEGYNANGETVTSISGEEHVGKLETKTDSKNATVKMNVINNYANTIKNIAILGRIPFEGNKNTTTLEDLGSNLTTTLNSALTSFRIDTSKVTIYYSTNAEATKDLTLVSNNWTTSTDNLQNVKSYLIVLNDYQMNTGDSLEFSYGITIPQNLSHNLKTYAIYTVYFDNVKDEETISEKVTATKVGIETSVGPEFNVNVTADKEQVEEGDCVTYTVAIKNTGKAQINNVSVKGTIKQGNKTLTSNEEKIVEVIPVGETVNVTYTVTARGMTSDEQKEMILNATINANDLEKQAEVQSNAIEVIKGYMKLSITTNSTEDTDDRRENQDVQYVVTMSNVNDTPKENVIVTDILPDGLSFKEATQNGTYNENTRTVTWNVGTLKAYETKVFVLTTTTNKLGENETQKTIANKIKVTTSDKELETEELTFRVTKPSLSITQTSQTSSTVAVGDIITYHVTIKNQGAGAARNIKITDSIPEGLEYIKSEYSVGGQTYTSKVGNDTAVISVALLGANETIELTIQMQAEDLEEETTKREVTNTVTVSADGIEAKTSNEIKHTIILKSESQTQDPSTDTEEENTYKISGIVWLDENLDGKKDENEQRLANIPVTLINAENGKIVTDITTGKKKEQQTSENGEYIFSNLKAGKYMVIFSHDTDYYGLTVYQKEGVNSDSNSDVVLVDAVMNGSTRKVAATDKIVIDGKNLDNIDMGLVINPQFDLKLDKVITKITVQNGNSTKEYEYKDSKLAKLDLDPKTINDTSIIIEYKIRITNEGQVAGYAKKIVDYLPQQMKFSSELNKDWYQSTTGNLYNASLANTLILPGETKELTLLLTKKMTENDTGIINNNAEICESYNDLGIDDVDSTPANKVQAEDDLSSADAIIGIKTGEIYVYIVLTAICIGILETGIYFINKKVLKRIR